MARIREQSKSFTWHKRRGGVALISRFVFLHIEKSAGTALRKGFFFKNIKGARYWHGDIQDCAMQDAIFIGGHKRFGFYSALDKSQTIFSSVLREPVSRIVSLYHYDKTTGSDFGLSREATLDDVIKFSEPFRQKIEQAQNKYISGKSIFEETISVLKSHNFVVGVQDDIDSYKSYIQNALDLPINQRVSANVAESMPASS